jgi:hypothetical protein
MKTILIMAQALATASGLDILRLDIQFNTFHDEFIGYLEMCNDERFKIKENGEVLIDKR